MSGADIAAEVAAAIREVGADVGAGALIASLIRPAAQPQNPWDAPAGEPTTYNLPVMDEGIKLRHDAGTLVQRRAHMLMVPALGIVPLTSDRINLRGREYAVLAVDTLAPGGVDRYYEVEIGGGVEAEVVPPVPLPWILSEGEWSDAGAWDDTAEWSDAA